MCAHQHPPDLTVSGCRRFGSFCGKLCFYPSSYSSHTTLPLLKAKNLEKRTPITTIWFCHLQARGVTAKSRRPLGKEGNGHLWIRYELLPTLLDRHLFLVVRRFTMRVLNILPDAIIHGFEGSTALTFPCPFVHVFQPNLLLLFAHS